MNLIKNKRLIDSTGAVLRDIAEEILLTADVIENFFMTDIAGAIKRSIIIPVFRYCLLNEDESVRTDITEDVLPGGSISISYDKGRRVSGSFNIGGNFDAWFPTARTRRLWLGTKFSIDSGIVVGNRVYWKKVGVVTPTAVKLEEGAEGKSITVSFSDKKALLDGTIGGSLEKTYEIPNQSLIQEATESLLLLDRGDGVPYDTKGVLFPNSYKNSKIEYRYSKTPGGNIWDIISDLANIISCGVGYDENGVLTLESNRDDMAGKKPVVWYFENDSGEVMSRSLDVDYSKAVNTVYVEGANINGKIFDAVAQNTNPLSPCNIETLKIINSVYVSDSNIYSDELAQDRADYELLAKSRELLVFGFATAFMPIFDVNMAVGCRNNDFLSLHNDRLIINSISFSASPDSDMMLGLINEKELPFR